MNKIFLTSITAIAICCPAFSATDIANNASSAACTESVLDTTSGTSNLQAKWTANTLNIDWYNGDTKLTSNTCTYDSGITVPSTNPSKTGYTFAGWHVRQSGFVLSSLFSPNSNSICDNGTDIGFAGKTGTYNQNTDTYGLTQSSGQWATAFSYGKIKGESRCSTQGVTNPWYSNGSVFASDNYANDITDETNTEGAKYCWCKPTLYAESNSNSYQTVATSSWVFAGAGGSASYCADFCAFNCANAVRSFAAVRGALFGVGGADLCQVDGGGSND